MPTPKWSAATQATLEAAGWHAGRNVSHLVDRWREQLATLDGLEMFPAAERALQEFGGLRIEQSGPGAECARSPFAIDPTLALGETERFSALALAVGARLFPLGEAIGGHAFLAARDDGAMLLVGDHAILIGNSIEEGISALVEGRMGRVVDQGNRIR